MNVRRYSVLTTLLLAFAAMLAASPAARAADESQLTGLAKQVQHELLMLPRYSVFDVIGFTVNGTKVTLTGQVTWPIVKDDAENAVKSVKGVTDLDDQIQVLPLSPMDEQTRMAEFRAIYNYPSLQRYGVGWQKPIHIIVDNGHVTLVGTVDSQADKDTAGIRANGVPGVFSVTNNLTVQAQ